MYKSLYKLLFFVVLGGAVLVMYAFDLPCVWRKLLGFSCPMCGMTRAVFAILRGNMTEAVRTHCMVLTLPILFGYILADGKLFYWRRLDTVVLVSTLAGFVVRWIWVLR